MSHLETVVPATTVDARPRANVRTRILDPAVHRSSICSALNQRTCRTAADA